MLCWLGIYTHLLMKSVNENIFCIVFVPKNPNEFRDSKLWYYKYVRGEYCIKVFLSDLCISFDSVKTSMMELFSKT